ncbi:hypothetical protein OHA91_15920 [Streptomyces erythrochromogenes]|uniref:Lipoprotein n=1 Tax=Streptomyces erythrochromogenes TaxID=285574 RepID=A0ABZ1QAZ9_9ACTN|nr:hypothetical protein [Streptomyces erythrochromogenes]
MNSAVRTRAGVTMAGAALLVGGLTACGGADGGKGADAKAHDPVEAVKASYLKTVAAKFAKAELSTVEKDGKASSQSGTKGWYPSGHDVVLKGGGEPDSRSIMMGDTVYTQLDKPLKGKTWMQMDLSKDGKPGVRLNEDPAEYLAMLLGQQKLTHVGAEKSDGVDAQHYKGSFTNADLLQADESTKAMEEKNRQYLRESVKHITAFEVDLWIGADGYPVRVDSSSTDDKGTSKTTAKFSDFGRAPAVQPPPADQVVTFDAVMKGVDADLEQVDKDLAQADKDLEEADKTLRDAGLPGLRR